MPSSQQIKLTSRLKFTGVPNVVIDKYTKKIGLNGLAVYTVLKKFADYEAGVCWPSIATIGSICGVSRFTVMRLITKLVDAGLLERRGSGKFGFANEYTFILPLDVATMQHRCSNHATGGVATMQHAIKEERDPLNETHGTIQPLSEEEIPF